MKVLIHYLAAVTAVVLGEFYPTPSPTTFEQGEYTLPGPTQVSTKINGKESLCRIEHCTLVCGDQAVVNFCKKFPHESLQTLTSEDCTLRNNCELHCQRRLIGNICETPDQVTVQAEANGLRRQLGNAEPTVVVEGSAKKWPEARVCYQIDQDVNQQPILKAMEHWTDRTGMQFLPCQKSQNSNGCCAPCGEYIRFIKGNGCWSFIGRQSDSCAFGGQLLSTGSSCTTGNIIHEIGHALGLLHEHTRIDRDQYIRVDEGNIQQSQMHNFEIRGKQVSGNGKYDYDSIMHYGNWAFAVNHKNPTIWPIDSNGNRREDVSIGQRESLSEGDVQLISSIYGLKIQPSQKQEEVPQVHTEFSSMHIAAFVAAGAAAIALLVMCVIVSRKHLRHQQHELCTPQSKSDPWIQADHIAWREKRSLRVSQVQALDLRIVV